MELHTFLTCLLAVTLLTLAPGVDTLLTIRNAGRGGVRDGVVTSLGICSGLFVHALVSACGLSIILVQTAWLYSSIKLVGAAYLVWLGLTSLRQSIRNRSGGFFPEAKSTGKTSLNCWRSLREGFLSNVLNPKAVIFYMAFLPQFIDPAGGVVSQSLLVAATHFSVGMLWLGLLSTTIDLAKKWLSRPRIGRLFHAATGTVMLFLGGRLLFEE